jgi:hypothetical protein
MPAPAGAVALMTEVVALTDCIIGDTRRQTGERFAVPADRVNTLTALGYVTPDGLFDLMHPDAAAAWRKNQRVGLTDRSLVCDDKTATYLWTAPGRRLMPDGLPSVYAVAEPTPDALRVLQLTNYDPGSAVYRYHSAANTVPGIISAFVRWGYSNPHCHLRQWDGDLHRRTVELLAMTADVIHVHMDWRTLTTELKYALRANQRAAITYHGSVLPGDERRVFVDHATDDRMGAIQFGARPYHGRHGVARYLPIPVPVRDYAALAAGHRRGETLRIAHSPTKREIKGTNALLEAVDYLRDADGVRVEVVMIENLSHGEALKVKATCDVTFDSFWLGMQGSGLEGAAMGQVVIAGDPEAAAEAAALNKAQCPWTFANDKYQLRDVIRRLAASKPFARAEAARVHDYVTRVHDYPVVGARYRDYFNEA